MDSPASAPAAPATDAGPSDGQVPQSNANSGVDNHSTQRQHRGAGAQKNAASPVTDDPEWDFGDGRKAKRSQIVQRLSETQKGAQKAWSERQTFEKRVNAFSERLEKLGLDPEEFERNPDAVFERGATAYLAKKLEEATRDPRELEAERVAKQRDEYKKQLDAQNEAKQKQEHQLQVDAHADELAGRFATALKEHGLPVQAKSVWLMASLLQGARNAGHELSEALISQVAKKASEIIDGDLNHYLPEEDGASLATRLGPKRLEALRRHMLQEQQSKFQPKQTQQRREPAKVMTNKAQANGYITFDEMLAASKRR